jgi:phosphatidylinositol-bisphosphatase
MSLSSLCLSVCVSVNTEPPLNFRPTYKLDIGRDTYDSGPKKRIPAWTDRILHTEKGLTCTAYDSDTSLKTSDHRPVFASFEALIDVDGVPNLPIHNRQQPAFSSESQVCTIM